MSADWTDDPDTLIDDQEPVEIVDPDDPSYVVPYDGATPV